MRTRSLVIALLLALVGAADALASAGIPDRVAAATLIVPMFRTGVNSATDPDDTLLVVQNVHTAAVIIHYQFWNVRGSAVGLYGNVTLTPNKTWSAAVRDLLNAASPTVRSALLPIPGLSVYYMGFVTIDVVTASTALDPLQAAYPIGNTNALEGFIYYTRLSKGSANGIAMVPIEFVGTGTAVYDMTSFYLPYDGRERIDADARACNALLARYQPCSGDDDDKIRRVVFRNFGSVPLNGSTQWVIFAWTPLVGPGGPTTICTSYGCNQNYPTSIYNENGAVVTSSTTALWDVVTVLSDASLSVAGFGSISYIPQASAMPMNFYAFSLNSASPSSNPNLTWDAIFEAYITP